MYLKRKVDQFLEDWKQNPRRKPLIIKGPRHVGKTRSIREFAQKHYESIVEINFAEEQKYLSITEDGCSPVDIIRNISRIDPSRRFIPQKTLLFFDGIQEFPDLTTSLKFFREDGRFDVICSGFLTSVQFQEIESISVGNKQDYRMYSMDFEEFLWAKGYQEDFIENLLRHMMELRPFSQGEMRTLTELFLDFTILGGMPEVVCQYIEKDTFEEVPELQEQILSDHREDIRKYAQGLDQTKILSVFHSIPASLARENRMFQAFRIRKNSHFTDYLECVEWLEDVGMVISCNCLNFPELPIRGNTQFDKFRLYLADTGLLIHMLDEETREDIHASKNLGVYNGALYENIVAEALVKSGYELTYYRRNTGTLEEDFFVRTRKSLIPVEVKSKRGTSRALRELIDNPKYADITTGIKFSANNIGFSSQIITFPYFCAFLLKRYLKTVDF